MQRNLRATQLKTTGVVKRESTFSPVLKKAGPIACTTLTTRGRCNNLGALVLTNAPRPLLVAFIRGLIKSWPVTQRVDRLSKQICRRFDSVEWASADILIWGYHAHQLKNQGYCSSVQHPFFLNNSHRILFSYAILLLEIHLHSAFYFQLLYPIIFKLKFKKPI